MSLLSIVSIFYHGKMLWYSVFECSPFPRVLVSSSGTPTVPMGGPALPAPAPWSLGLRPSPLRGLPKHVHETCPGDVADRLPFSSLECSRFFCEYSIILRNSFVRQAFTYSLLVKCVFNSVCIETIASIGKKHWILSFFFLLVLFKRDNPIYGNS